MRAKASTFDFQLTKKKLLAGQEVQLKVASDSMVPVLEIGEIITIGPRPTKGYSLFDIVLFEQANQLNVHFLAKIDNENQLYLTRSLKSPGEHDYPLCPKDILGIVKNKKLTLWQKIKVLLVS